MVIGSTTSAEFLAKIPKKSKEDHAKDQGEMKKLGEKCKNIDLNPKMDIEEAINLVKATARGIVAKESTYEDTQQLFWWESIGT